jgi:hypothetical protein
MPYMAISIFFTWGFISYFIIPNLLYSKYLFVKIETYFDAQIDEQKL